MDQTFLDKIKKKIEEHKKFLESELAKFAKKDKHDKNNYKTKWPEMGDETDQNIAEVALYSDRLSLEQALEKALRDVNNALGRIQKGTYGKCKYCKEEIGEKRLEIRPVSSACVKCKKKLTMEE